MRIRTAALTLLLAAPLAACAAEPTRLEIEQQCEQAIEDRAKGDRAKPAACEALPQDDYDTLNLSHALTETGLIDEEGRVDPERLMGTEPLKE
ncbi:hypothetical protein [Streptomyces syringium]|uniref:hypothetical protein n=1 Tax=Streptomyces syringium TaxID=76729 RepID=UPI0033CD127E